MSNFNDEFQKVYSLKKNEEGGIDAINEFCSKWEGLAGIEEIPFLMRLYYDDVYTSEQNEFVTWVIDAVIQKEPEKAFETIINNYSILIEEDATWCIYYLASLMIFANVELIKYSAVALAKADDSIREVFLAHINKRMSKKKSESAQTAGNQFLKLYNEERSKLT